MLTGLLPGFAVVALGVTLPFSIRFVGDLPVAELVVLAMLPVLLVSHWRQIIRLDLLPVYGLCALWLFAQIMTDIYRGMTAPSEWMRSYAAIIFFVFDIMVMGALVSGSTRRKLLFFGSFAVSALIRTRFFPEGLPISPSWKFGYSEGTMTLALLLSCYFYRRRRYGAVVILILALIAINLVENFRSPLLFLFITLAIVVPLIPEHVGNLRLLPRQGSALRVGIVIVLSLAAGIVAREVLAWATERGISGAEEQQKNEQQAASGSWANYLFAGRPEFLVSLQAVIDSPLIGHGSDPNEPKYLEIMIDRQVETGGMDMLDSLSEWLGGRIPVHSYLLQAWVGAGILGSLIWFYLLALCVKSLVRIATTLPPTAPYFTYLLILLFWNILFSPFGSTVRMTVACVIVLMVDILGSRDPASPTKPNLHMTGWRRGRWINLEHSRPSPLHT